MSQLISQPNAVIQDAIGRNCLSCMPTPVVQKAVQDAMGRATMIFSNVPGPQEPVHFGPRQLTGLQVLFPNFLPQALIVSLNGYVYFNLVLDPLVVEQSEKIPGLYLDELKELAEQLNVEMPPTVPWPAEF